MSGPGARRKKICCCCFSGSDEKTEETIESRGENGEESCKEFPDDDHFVENLPTLELGSMVNITGTVQKTCLRFIINFLSDTSDIAFHFNPRLDRQLVVRNCKLDKSWGQEERTSVQPFDFTVDAPFNVSFLCGSGEFMVAVNGKHFCAYSYRLDLKSICMLEVQGPVVISNFHVQRVNKYPEHLGHKYYKVPVNKDVQVVDGAFQQSLEVPFLGIMPSTFDIGWQLEIYGRIKILPQSFLINLQDTVNVWPHPNIPLHLNPRFATTNGENSFVRNTWHKGAWRKEERAPSFPFSAGNMFSLAVRKEYEGFSVWVDGKLSGEFLSQHKEFSIKAVYIQGDIFLNHITLRTEISDMYCLYKNYKKFGL